MPPDPEMKNEFRCRRDAQKKIQRCREVTDN
jgi:hypothetical protein